MLLEYLAHALYLFWKIFMLLYSNITFPQEILFLGLQLDVYLTFPANTMSIKDFFFFFQTYDLLSSTFLNILSQSRSIHCNFTKKWKKWNKPKMDYILYIFSHLMMMPTLPWGNFFFHESLYSNVVLSCSE